MIAIMFSALAHQSSERSFPAGAIIFRQEETVRRVFWVVSGMVHLERHTPAGRCIVLQRAGPEDRLAEASLFADRYHCDAVAASACTVRSLHRDHVLAYLQNHTAAALELLESASREVQHLRGRIEVAALPRVADRLDAWLALRGERGTRTWREVATMIDVSPEALYRELSRRKRTLQRAGSAGGQSGS
ncbi:Crp/Fnr family transcriptional regulator (plasmid) [Acuticoccus sp. MNP-M23]|uniref:Crp/Fnr family transcriptional regulator n=1 Tax=Acuticoccus sp. MNP-M23 TaxID=3072793 RepID=UPI0028155D5E|nr:Crp/Fnr family transcriptional regulator [Acuticoccus sp. MNP-M23]WMS45242.1 Crp/Fnr family transcriptional regulator [Acuticoccus sp. MNP-M23]